MGDVHFIHTNKFKTISIVYLIRRPLSREEATKNSLLSYVLKKGSANYPSIKSLNRALEELYGSVFDVAIIKKGEEQIIQFYMEFINEQRLLKRCIEFMKDIINNPLTVETDEGAGFNERIFDTEMDNLKKDIESLINVKSEYVRLRCIEEMFKGEPFGVSADGYIEDLPQITNESLLAHYNEIKNKNGMWVVVGELSGYEEVRSWL